jgi:hypothetical protein
VSQKSTDVAKLGERVTALVEQGLDVAEAYASAKGGTTKASKDYAKAIEKHEKSVAKHRDRIRSQRRESVTMTVASGAAAVMGVIDVASQDTLIPVPAWLWLLGSAFAAITAVRARYDATHAIAPEPPALQSVFTVNDLRRDAIGWQEAQGLAAVRRQLAAMIPAVTGLHPDAGQDLAGADAEAAPALAAQVTRLAVLDQVRRELPGSTAADAAQDAAETVRARLAEGVAVYDRLLAAASTMLASPDLGRPSLDVLGPAADALAAYAAGLRTAAG